MSEGMEERIAEAVVSRAFSRILGVVEGVTGIAAAYLAGEWAASFAERPLPLGLLGVFLALGGFLAGWLLRALAQSKRSPMWVMISGLSGAKLRAVKDAYPDGMALGECSDERWEAISQLVKAGVLTSSEKGIVTSATRFSLTVGAERAIRAHERRFRKL